MADSKSPEAGSEAEVAPKGPGAPTWQSEKEVDICVCKKKFGLTRRKHHCRGCGQIFCDECTAKRHALPASFNVSGLQRVCNDCFIALRSAALAENPGSGACAVPVYDDVFKDLKARLTSFIAADKPDSWKQRAQGKSATFWTAKMENSSLLCVKAAFFVPLPLDMVFEMYRSVDNWPKWQPEILEMRRIEQVTHANETEPMHAEVMYGRYKLPVVDNRDACVYSCGVPGGLGLSDVPGTRSLINCSVDHPLVPPMKGVIRALVNMSCGVFQPHEKDGTAGTHITTITHSDPRGLIPPFLVNQLVSLGVEQIEDMIKVMTKMATENGSKLPQPAAPATAAAAAASVDETPAPAADPAPVDVAALDAATPAEAPGSPAAAADETAPAVDGAEPAAAVQDI